MVELSIVGPWKNVVASRTSVGTDTVGSTNVSFTARVVSSVCRACSFISTIGGVVGLFKAPASWKMLWSTGVAAGTSLRALTIPPATRQTNSW